MSKKTNRRNKKHRSRTHKRSKHHRKHTRKQKRYEMLTLPGSQGLSLFGVTEPHKKQKILVNPHKQTGNMIPGLRNM